MKKTLRFIASISFLQLMTSPFIQAQVKLEKVNEFRIASFETFDIVDYDPEKKNYLAYAPRVSGFEVVVIDEKGRVLSKKNLQGQGPEQFNSALNFLGFSGSENILVITPNELINYDNQLNYKGRKKLLVEDIFVTSRLTSAPIFYYPEDTQGKQVYAVAPSLTSVFMTVSSLENQFLVKFFDPDSNKQISFLPLKDRSIYGKLDKSVYPMYAPIVTIDRNKKTLYATATLDGEISVMDIPSGKVISTIKINHGKFGSFNKFPVSDRSLSSYSQYTLASMNQKLVSIEDGIFVLDYVREIEKEVFERNYQEDPKYHHFQDPKYHRMIFFDEKIQLSNDIPMPKNGKLMISLPGNRLLFKIVDPEVELDFIRYEVYKVVLNK